MSPLLSAVFLTCHTTRFIQKRLITNLEIGYITDLLELLRTSSSRQVKVLVLQIVFNVNQLLVKLDSGKDPSQNHVMNSRLLSKESLMKSSGNVKVNTDKYIESLSAMFGDRVGCCASEGTRDRSSVLVDFNRAISDILTRQESRGVDVGI